MAGASFGPGMRGEIAQSIQEALLAAGFDPGRPDGQYGDRTARALGAFLRAKRRPEAQAVDEDIWPQLMNGTPFPPLDRRALGLTAAIEGHGYSLALGNWDQAWLTWGIIGFTLKHGEVQKIVLETERLAPDCIVEAFGMLRPKLLEVMRAAPAVQQRWADEITVGHGIAEPWRIAFARLGTYPVVRDIQRQRVYQGYYLPALALAKQLGLESTLGIALCFDIQVQNGGLRDAARAAIEAARARGTRGAALREIVADAVADAARAEYRDDVRRRKLAIATGGGAVHGLKLELASWGLADAPI